MSSRESASSFWKVAGCGCLLIFALGLASCGACAWFGVRTAQDLSDPDRRSQRSVEVLQARQLPSGYESEMVISLPMVMKVVLLGGDDRRFFYMTGVTTDIDPEDVLNGEASLHDVLDELSLNVEQVIDEGQGSSGDLRWAYLATRGEFDLERISPRRGFVGRIDMDFDTQDADDERELISTALLLGCGNAESTQRRRIRLAIWSGSEWPTSGGSDPAQLRGTPADADEIGAFLEQFGFCE